MKKYKFNVKIGDKVVCINNDLTYDKCEEGWNDKGEQLLELYNIYTIENVISEYNEGDDGYTKLYIQECGGEWFLKYRFVTLKKMRRLKLDKINENNSYVK